MRVLVWGATGFIGQHLCAGLRARGHELSATMAGAQAVVHLANIAHARASAQELGRPQAEDGDVVPGRRLEAGRRRKSEGERRKERRLKSFDTEDTGGTEEKTFREPSET